MRAHYFVVSALFAAILAAGCGGITDPSKNQVETFTDILPNDGFGPIRTFNVSKNGELSVRITALSPTPSAVIGLYLGQTSGGNCAYVTNNAFVGLNRDVFQGPIQKGSWCLQVYDSGNVTVDQTYTMQVSHP